MLIKYVIRYAPSILVPAFSAFGALFFYTRLLTPEEFGEYILIFNWTNLLTVVAFYWLQTSLPRLLPQAAREKRMLDLCTTSYMAFFVISGVLILIALLCGLISSSAEIHRTVWLAIPLTLARTGLAMNLIQHRNALNPLRYGVLECGHAIFGLLCGLVLVYFLHMGSSGALLGMTAGYLLMWCLDYKTLKHCLQGKIDVGMLKDMAHFGIPLVFSYGFAFILAASDRFFIEYFCDTSAVGIYSAGYTLMDRTMTVIFMLTVLPAYTLTVHKLEHESHEAAREQLNHSGVMMFVLAFPACAGLILLREPIATVAIGSAFRAGALDIMPWVTVAVLLSSITTHYFNQAFHLGKKSYLMIATQGPVALINIIGNLLLIPRYGIMGAAYCTLFSYSVLMILSIIIGRRAFAMPFPFRPTMHILLSVAIMAIILTLWHGDNSPISLAVRIVIGGAVYTLGLFAFDVLNMRTHLWQRARRGSE